jgi:hypothetical protein
LKQFLIDGCPIQRYEMSTPLRCHHGQQTQSPFDHISSVTL